jgi:hypothetical protein
VADQTVIRAACVEDGCSTPVADAPENRCGGATDGGPQGCGELFCGAHLYHTCRDGDLCSADYGNASDHPTSECCGLDAQ